MLSEVVAACPLPIIAVDLTGRVTSWNPAAEHLFGWNVDEVLGTALPVVSPDRREEAQQIRNQTEAGLAVYDLEVERCHRDGTIMPLSLSTAPLHDDQGQLVGTMLTYMDLRWRKGAEATLRESEQRYRAAFEGAAIGITRTGLDGSYLDVNRRLCDIVGYEPEEVVGIPFSQLTYVEDRASDRHAVERMLAGEQTTYRTEKRYIHRDGHLVWVRATVTLLRDASGSPDHFIAVVEDISRRKVAEEELQRQARILTEHAALLDLTQEAILVKAFGTGIIQFWNRGAEELYGWTADEAIGAVSHSLLQTSFPEPLDAIDETLNRTGRWSGDLVHHTKDGREIVVSSRWALHVDQDGHALGSLEVNADITEQRKSEAALRTSEAQLRTLIAQAPVGICVTTADGVFDQMNPAYAGILGYDPVDLVGRHFNVVTPGDRVSVTNEMRRRFVEEKSGSLLELPMMHKDGHLVTILATTIPLFGIDGTQRRVSFGIDITERKAAELAMEHRAHHDPLTGLANRLLLYARLDGALAHARRHGSVVGLLFVDLDGFKAVNDRYGHDRGDALLLGVAGILARSVRASDTVARFAGDEFVILLQDVGSADNAEGVAQKVLDTLRQHEAGLGVDSVTASIGISIFPGDGQSGEELLECADQAMYRAKRRGKNTYALYSRTEEG
jgi:diguanylate cyclase (GGDEF)-like protein/PAS domain S-box-containing protein